MFMLGVRVGLRECHSIILILSGGVARCILEVYPRHDIWDQSLRDEPQWVAWRAECGTATAACDTGRAGGGMVEP